MRITILTKLITFKTLSHDHRENLRALTWVKKELRAIPLYIQEYRIAGFPSLVATTQKTKKPTLWLVGHMDVVSGSPAMFRPRVVSGRIYGRGAFDMKFALACYLTLLKELKPRLRELNLGVMITTDEELGGYYGAGALLSKGYGGKTCVVPDGGANWQLQVSAKGVMQLEIKSRGKSAHGSRPWMGSNAAETLMDFLTRLRRHFPKEPCDSYAHRHNTINTGRLEGGTEANRIPDAARALVDIRFTSRTPLAEMTRLVARVKRPNEQIRITPLSVANGYRVDVKNIYARRFLALAREARVKPQYVHSDGSSDARFFIHRGIPAIVTRPKGGGLHSESEWIDLADLARFYRVLKEFVVRNVKT